MIRKLILMVIFLSFLFYALLLFDTYGDAVGFYDAYWVLITAPLIPVVICKH